MKPQTNITCTHCDHAWQTESPLKMVTCTSCNGKTINPLWLRANNVKLFRLWSGDSNDRQEIARTIAKEFDVVQQWALKHFIKASYRKDVELTDMGLEWTRCNNCEENKIEEKDMANQDNPCENCENSTEYIQIEETEDLNDLDYKTIMGTDEFFDLTTKRYRKRKDWNKTLSNAWKTDPQKGCDTLLTLTKIAMAEGQDLTKSDTVKQIDNSMKKDLFLNVAHKSMCNNCGQVREVKEYFTIAKDGRIAEIPVYLCEDCGERLEKCKTVKSKDVKI